MAEVTLEPVGPERRETIANLFQLYVHDFTDFWTERQVELGEDGRFPPYPFLDAYWEDPHRAAFLIRADANLAGFVLLNRHSHSGQPCDWSVAEFFVPRHRRRQGVGRSAALAAIAGRSGLWEIAVARRNTPAQPFWRGVAEAAASGPVEALDQADANWNGLILRFRVA